MRKHAIATSENVVREIRQALDSLATMTAGLVRRAEVVYLRRQPEHVDHFNDKTDDVHVHIDDNPESPDKTSELPKPDPSVPDQTHQQFAKDSRAEITQRVEIALRRESLESEKLRLAIGGDVSISTLSSIIRELLSKHQIIDVRFGRMQRPAYRWRIGNDVSREALRLELLRILKENVYAFAELEAITAVPKNILWGQLKELITRGAINQDMGTERTRMYTLDHRHRGEIKREFWEEKTRRRTKKVT